MNSEVDYFTTCPIDKQEYEIDKKIKSKKYFPIIHVK
jgi:hypothetical protein